MNTTDRTSEEVFSSDLEIDRLENLGPQEEQQNPSEEWEVVEPDLRDLPLKFSNIPRFIVLGLIRAYQATFSRTLPQDTCRFYPSCSHYGYQAIYKYGVLKGGLMAVWRVLRCNPFNKGGFDPVQ
jgi:putative membrane protein insertion efficiency factor